MMYARCMWCVGVVIVLLAWTGGRAAPVQLPTCQEPWRLPNTKLKDHALFVYDRELYVVATRILLPNSDGRGETTFAYGRRGADCRWENLGTALTPGPSGAADEAYLWAPHVVEAEGVWYMWYTGVNRNIAQSIMLATTPTPNDPTSWVKQGVVFRPAHPGMVYPGPMAWSDARDPQVFDYNGQYYLLYTGLDANGGIVGVATSASVRGPWRDLGAMLTTALPVVPESPFVVQRGADWYLFYNAADGTAHQMVRWGPSPFGPWQAAQPLPFGWAYDFARTADNDLLASYLLGNGEAIGVAPVRWDDAATPPTPLVGFRAWLPLVQR